MKAPFGPWRPSRMRTGGGGVRQPPRAEGGASPWHAAPGARARGLRRRVRGAARGPALVRRRRRRRKAAAPPRGGAMELEAARRAVLAAVRGTCAADLPRLLHWMRNTSKRGLDRTGPERSGTAQGAALRVPPLPDS